VARDSVRHSEARFPRIATRFLTALQQKPDPGVTLVGH
jgi:hypothetical protein